MADTEAKKIDVASQSSTNLMVDTYTGFAEETYFRSPLVPSSYKPPYNSDDIWQRTGDYKIYEDMVNDDQVSVCLQLKKDLVLGSGYDLISTADGQEDIISQLEASLEGNCDKPFVNALEEVITAYEFGFSLSEKIFKVGDDGKLYLKAIRTRHPNSWLLHQNEKGDVERYVQVTSDGPKDIEPRSLIHFVNSSRFQNPYGKSDLRAAYNAWFSKRQVVRYFAIFLEKAASPIPVAKYDSKNAPAGTADELLEILKSFQTKTALSFPKEIELMFLEAKNTGEAYSRAIDIFNMFIGRSLFIPDLLGVSGSETSGGSFSLGKEQINMFFMHIARRRQSLEALVNRHFIIPRL